MPAFVATIGTSECQYRKWPGAIHRLVGDNEWPLSAATGADQRSLRRARSIRASTFGNMRVTTASIPAAVGCRPSGSLS